MTARPARKQQPVPSSAEKCSVGGGTCGEPMAEACGWRMHKVNGDGERVYDNTTCGLKLCSGHVKPAKGKPLCAWHYGVAEREGLI